MVYVAEPSSEQLRLEEASETLSLERRRGLRVWQSRPVKVFEPTLSRYYGGQTENVSSMRVTRDNGTISTYRLMLNHSQSRLQLGDPNNPSGSLSFRIAGQHVTLEGDLHGEPTRMDLVRSPANFLLVSRGFHWITEFPFNR